ncbi:hypothetical protein M9458_031907, partial [Cirrhinus mrigala]
MFWAEEFLFNIQQADKPLEQYVEEFLSVLHLVSWSDSTINACFQMGLKDDQLFCSLTPDDCCKPIADFINHVLALNNSKFYVDVEDSNPPPIRKHADTPVHHQPASSTCCSNELTLSSPPSPELLPHPQPRTRDLLTDSGPGPVLKSAFCCSALKLAGSRSAL